MIKGRLKMRLCAALALGAGLGLRLWFVTHAARIDGDSLIYGNIARNWLQHGVYGFAQTARGITPTLIRLPGYPIFLAACFALFGLDHYIAVMYIQCVIDLLTCLLVAGLARRLFGPRAAMVALWLGALCPFTAAYAAAPLTETLTLASIALTFYALERWRAAGRGFNRWLWVIAAGTAYSILLRPEQGLLAAAVIPAMLWMAARPPERLAEQLSSPVISPRRSVPRPLLRAVAPVFLAALCVLLPLAPWTLRNWRTFHVLQPLAPRFATDPGETVPLGFQRWYRTWAIDYASTEEVYWNYDSAPIDIANLPNRAFDNDDQYLRTAALLADYNESYNATPQLDARFAGLARERIHADPIRYYLALPVARLLNMALRPRAEMLPISLDWWNWKEHRRETEFATLFAALNLAYFVVGVVGLWLWHRRGWGADAPLAWSMLAFVLLRCALLLTLDNSEPRYTLEFFPLLILWASAMVRPALKTDA
jgi:4-amino-4-deoxy-L-arabinose transferase-like glycosyltransferase